MKTPRTDASEWDYYEDCTPEDNMVVLADFARQLERELIAVTALADRLAEALERIRQGCQEDMDSWRDYPQHREAVIGGIGGNKAIAEAAIAAYQATKP